MSSLGKTILMSQSYLLQKLASVGVASTISAFTIIGTVLTPGMEDTAQAATFTEIGEAGELIPDAQGPVIIPQFDTIEGIFPSTIDIDLYQLQLDFDADVTIGFGGDLFLFDEIGRGLGTGSNELSFSGVAGEIFYLGVNGSVALNANADPILDPSMPGFVGPGTLASWENRIGLPVVLPYQVSLTATSASVPEPASTLSFIALGTLGAGSTLLRKKKHKSVINKAS